jgi:lysophospholipase L1-like esterase
VPNAQYIDVHSAMLGADGQPRGELFGADRLHMNAAGYTLWRREINARLP